VFDESDLEGADLEGTILSPEMIAKFAKELSAAKNLDKIVLEAQ